MEQIIPKQMTPPEVQKTKPLDLAFQSKISELIEEGSNLPRSITAITSKYEQYQLLTHLMDNIARELNNQDILNTKSPLLKPNEVRRAANVPFQIKHLQNLENLSASQRFDILNHERFERYLRFINDSLNLDTDRALDNSDDLTATQPLGKRGGI